MKGEDHGEFLWLQNQRFFLPPLLPVPTSCSSCHRGKTKRKWTKRVECLICQLFLQTCRWGRPMRGWKNGSFSLCYEDQTDFVSQTEKLEHWCWVLQTETDRKSCGVAHVGQTEFTLACLEKGQQSRCDWIRNERNTEKHLQKQTWPETRVSWLWIVLCVSLSEWIGSYSPLFMLEWIIQ